MKKVILVICLVSFLFLLSIISVRIYSSNKDISQIQNIQNQQNIENTETNKKILTSEKIEQNKDNYKKDLEKVIDHILNDKITYKKTTLKEMLNEYNIEADKIYQSYLSDRENYEKYYNKLNKITGTISLYPDAICEELKPIFEKYDIFIHPNTECDSYIYENYIKGYNIKNSDELKELIDYHEASFNKIRNYIVDILK